MPSMQTIESKSKKKKTDKYLDLSREQQNLWNMKVTVVPIATGTLRTILQAW